MTPQTPPTDRPLTAGAAKLEDVLFFKLKDLILEQSEGEWDEPMIVRDAHHFANNLRPLFARPATSAASEGVELTTAREVFDLLASDDPVIAAMRKAGLDDSRLITLAYALIAHRKDAAIASQPVSERERELEGALRRAADDLRDIGSQNPRPSNSPDPEHENYLRRTLISLAQLANTRARQHLTAQPAGEGK